MSVFRLAGDAGLEPKMEFAVYSPQGFNWNVHHNVINNCNRLVEFDVFGGPAAVFLATTSSRAAKSSRLRSPSRSAAASASRAADLQASTGQTPSR